MNNCPIGVFDSGVGGLSVFSRLIRLLPEENYIYFGDTLNLPYGNKTKNQLLEITRGIFDFFGSKNAKAVVMACNTTSAAVYDILKYDYKFKIYPMVQIVSKSIASRNYKKIGVFATSATAASHAYKREIQKNNPLCSVYEIACPSWADIVENELQNDIKSIENVKACMNKMLKYEVEKIILGCTHYPYLMNILAEFAPRDMFIDPAFDFAKITAEDLKDNNLLSGQRNYEPQFYVSANPARFISASKLFYKVQDAKEISLPKSLTRAV